MLDRALNLRSFACINLDQWANLFGHGDFVLQSANANANVTFFTGGTKEILENIDHCLMCH